MSLELGDSWAELQGQEFTTFKAQVSSMPRDMSSSQEDWRERLYRRAVKEKKGCKVSEPSGYWWLQLTVTWTSSTSVLRWLASAPQNSAVPYAETNNWISTAHVTLLLEAVEALSQEKHNLVLIRSWVIRYNEPQPTGRHKQESTSHSRAMPETAGNV